MYCSIGVFEIEFIYLNSESLYYDICCCINLHYSCVAHTFMIFKQTFDLQQNIHYLY